MIHDRQWGSGDTLSALNYCLTFRACFTKFSITPSNTTLSACALSRCCTQYAKTSPACLMRPSSVATCALSSVSVILDKAADVVAQRILTAAVSIAGARGALFFLLRADRVEAVRLTEVVEVLSGRERDLEPAPPPLDGESDLLRICMEGRTSFCCLEAGRISSRSTGTPKETRNSRRILDRTQLGG